MTIHSETLHEVAREIFGAAGLPADKAEAVARYLIEADLMGHTTHGLALAPWYLQSLRDGVMATHGAPKTVSDRGAAICWRGSRLPGAWLVSTGVALCMERARQYGTATLVIGDSHHIGALTAYLPDATAQGFMISIASSSPSGAQVAPFGGLRGVFTPDPVAYGIPTPGEPILIDISASISTVNMAQRMIQEGRSFEYPWLMDAEGNLSTDPKAVTAGGSLLPTGGLDHGQKGYGMALAVEALTQGLAGYGRADAPKGTNAAVTSPQRFGEGAIEGVAAPESANNAAAQTSFIPLLTLGIPANATMAMMVGALILHGVTPGPNIISTEPALFWGLIASMWIGNAMLLILNLPLIGIWVKMLGVPYRLLFPVIVVLCCIGVYTVNNSSFDVLVMLIFGVAGYLLIKLGCEPTPLLLGLVLGPMLEGNLRRAMLTGRGDPTVFLTRPISAVLLGLAALCLLMMILPQVRRTRDIAFEE